MDPGKVRVLGITGTRDGMTSAQKLTSVNLLTEFFYRANNLHHGDCIGVDAEFAEIADELGGILIVGHPPIEDKYRAYFSNHIDWPEENYIERNRRIVDLSEVLVAFPKSKKESRFGGTWYTVRYARTQGTPILIVWPDGTVADG